MDSMDLKGIAWVGNVYQKFEAMCLDVEETMYEETAKYVENQVQTVGATMKRFYSDVMQDLHPPSSIDRVKVAATDLLPNPYTDVGILDKPKENIKEHAKKHVQVKGFSEKNSSSPYGRVCSRTEVSKDHAARDEIVEISSLASVEVGNGQFREAVEAKVYSSSLDANDTSTATATSGPVLQVESRVRKGEELRSISTTGIVPAESNETSGDCRLISQVGSHSSDDMQHGQSSNKEVHMSHTGDGNIDTIEYNDTRDLRTETGGGEAPDSNLEKSCVLVVGENAHSDFSNQRKNKSYKKKIRQAFSLKMKSGRKQEYKQLAAEHVNDITRSNLQSVETEMPTLTMNSTSKNSQARDLSESEWELL